MGKLRTVVALLLVLALAACGEVMAVQPRAGDVDLQVPAAEINITTTHPAPLRLNDNLTISALVNNIGTHPAVNVALDFSYNTTNSSLIRIMLIDTVGTIPTGSNATATAYWNTSGLDLEPAVNYTIWVQAVNDTGDTDTDPSNDLASVNVSFLPDVVPVIEGLFATSYSAVVGDSIGLEATLNNAGVRPAINESVSFHLDNLSTPFSVKNVDLPAGAITSVPTLWGTVGIADGNHTITVKVRELSKSITIAFKYRTNPHFTSLTASAYSGNVGDKIYVNATLNNNGTEPAISVPLSYFVDAGGVVVGNATIDVVPVGTATNTSFLWDTAGLIPGNHTVKARIAGTTKEIRTAPVVLGPELLPDLAITDFWASNVNPLIGELIKVNVTVTNLGQATPSQNATLQVLRDSVWSIGEVNVTPLAPGESFEYGLDWPTGDLQAHAYGLRAQIDPYSEIPDLNDSNNDRRLELNFTGTVDLAVQSLLFTRYQTQSNFTGNVTIGEGVYVWITIANLGTVGSVQDTTLSIFVDSAASPFRNFTLGSIAVGGNYTATFFLDSAQQFNDVSPTDHNMSAVVDPAGVNQEGRKDNNRLTAVLTVFPKVLGPSLTVVDLRLSKSSVRYEEVLIITAHVANPGDRPAYCVTLRVSAYRGGASPQLIGDQQIPEMMPGEHLNRTQAWTVLVSEGNYTITAVLDPQNAIAANHSNNMRAVPVTILPTLQQGPDVRIQNVTFLPSEPKSGDKVVVTVSLRNLGDTSAADIVVTLLVNGLALGNSSITELAPGAVRNVTFRWNASKGDQRLVAQVRGSNFAPVTGTSMGLEVTETAVEGGGSYLPMIIIIIVLLIIAVLLIARGAGGAAPARDEEE